MTRKEWLAKLKAFYGLDENEAIEVVGEALQQIEAAINGDIKRSNLKNFIISTLATCVLNEILNFKEQSACSEDLMKEITDLRARWKIIPFLQKHC